jgi:S1-C subfamily serine protease
MRVELRITSGSRAGQRETFDKSVISVGRHPTNDLRFDPELDPDVSGRHAEIRVVGEKVTLRDLDSTNGTYVNGQRIGGERALFDGDVIGLGDPGPKVELRFPDKAAVRSSAGSGAGAGGAASASPLTATGASAGASAPPRRDTAQRIALAVARETGKLRAMIGGLAGLVVVGVGIAYLAGHRGAAEAEQRIAALLAREDSLSRAFNAQLSQLQGRSAGLDSAVQFARAESERLRAALQAARQSGDAAGVEALSRELDASSSRQNGLVRAAAMDYERIFAQNHAGLVFLAVRMADDDTQSGTGFNVAPSGIVVTNRHVVQDERGRPPREIVATFDGVRGWKRAQVIKVSETDELAWLRLEPGNYPTVAGVAQQAGVRVGSPIAIIGFPLGTGTAGMSGNINTLLATSTQGMGIVSKVLSDTLQIDAFAAPGSSGSPIFDSRGLVIGVLFGAAAESDGRIIYAVPSHRLSQQMPSEARDIMR